MISPLAYVESSIAIDVTFESEFDMKSTSSNLKVALIGDHFATVKHFKRYLKNDVELVLTDIHRTFEQAISGELNADIVFWVLYPAFKTSYVQAFRRKFPKVKIIGIVDLIYINSFAFTSAKYFDALIPQNEPIDVVHWILKKITQGFRFYAPVFNGSLINLQPKFGQVELKHLEVALSDNQLSIREQEIIPFLVTGHSYQEIGLLLELNINTVRFYASQLYQKLKIKGRNELKYRYYASCTNTC